MVRRVLKHVGSRYVVASWGCFPDGDRSVPWHVVLVNFRGFDVEGWSACNLDWLQLALAACHSVGFDLS